MDEKKPKRRYYLKGIPVYASKVSRGGTVVSCWLSPEAASRLAEGLLAAVNRSEGKDDLLDVTIYDKGKDAKTQITVTRKPQKEKAKAASAS
jgi:hypothetical protein